ncbi:hypothetical protein F5Y12DRAFT_725958 [Xylaria sp. FL1777]|nr:hypothetical protein F5Y12DRAFT_725958 [Xylaria sp. FL1777]
MLSLEHDVLIRSVESNAQPANLPSPPGIPYELFIGFSWAGVSVATVFLLGRLYARIRKTSRLYLDDFCIFLAYVLVVTTAALWQYGAKDMYYNLNVNAGIIPVGPDFIPRLRRYLYVSFTVEVLFYITLVMFKLSMLFFFKRLGTSVDNFNYLWWPVFLLSLATFFINIGDVEYQCYFGDINTISVSCISSEVTTFLRVTLYVNAVFDIVTDVLIMLIPITLLWNVRIQWKKKIAIMGIFSLSLITIGIAIARVADIKATQQSTGIPDSTYLWFWSALQASLCIVVACSSAFRQLFTDSAEPKKPAWSPTASYYERLRSNFRSRAKKQNSSLLYDITAATETGESEGYITRDEVPSHDDGEMVKLVPGEQGPIVTCFPAPSTAHLSGNRISYKQEYHITRDPK